MKYLLLLTAVLYTCSVGAQASDKPETRQGLIREMNDFFKKMEWPKDSALYMEAVDAYEATAKDYSRSMYIWEYTLRERSRRESDKLERDRIAYMNKKYGIATAKKLLKGDTWLGMKDEMVKDAFGDADVKETRTAHGTTETWYYWGREPQLDTHKATNERLYYSITIKNHIVIAFTDL